MRVAAILPCYKSKEHVLDVLRRMPEIVSHIYCVDDACPIGTGKYIEENIGDPRVRVVYHPENAGVGGAVCTGYKEALRDDVDICVKVDSDGQMDPANIAFLVAPIVKGIADYTKGNRFANVEDIGDMPMMRIVGNVGLSFLTKSSSGYWGIFDPTNGFTAIHARVLERLPLDKISRRYFFESDMLFRLGTLSANVVDIPMPAIYGSEMSNLRIGDVLLPFLARNLGNIAKRVFYNYFLRDFSIGSIYLLLAVFLLSLGGTLGVAFWVHGIMIERAATAGQVMFSALPVIFGMQLLLAFTSYDMGRSPTAAIHPLLSKLTGARDERQRNGGRRQEELAPPAEAGRHGI